MRSIALTDEDMDDLAAGNSINVPASDGDEEFILIPPGWVPQDVRQES